MSQEYNMFMRNQVGGGGGAGSGELGVESGVVTHSQILCTPLIVNNEWFLSVHVWG